jgi:hypothetical protein
MLIRPDLIDNKCVVAEFYLLMTSLLTTGLHIACLCAQWCGTCRDYHALFHKTLTDLGIPPAYQHWIDIEDQSELMGEAEVDNFPTLLIFHNKEVYFYGAVIPQAAHLQRLTSHTGELISNKPVVVSADIRSLAHFLSQ